jgi:putative ABC transport system permease protein
MRTLGLETRHACRSILKRPAMSAIVVITLGLGLGANAAVFSMIDALVLRPFTMPDVDRITLFSFTRPDDIDRREALSPGDYLDMKRQQPDAFERLAAVEWWNANLVGQDEPENVQGFFVSSDFFPTLGVQPVAGRGFLPAEETQGGHRRVVLGHGLWQRRFASDASIVGRSIEVDGVQHEVVGIAPPGFDFPMGAQIWAPLSFTAQNVANRRSLYLTGFGRLAPGRTLEEAKAQMAIVGDRLARDHPDTNKGREARVYTLGDGMMDIGIGPILSMWQASACFVLLIACANIASLLLARGAERQREMAVRLAIGASRARVVRELLIESGLLALAAVPAALAVAWVGLKLIVAYMPAKIARFVAGWHAMDVDLRLIAFTSALAIVTALVFGLIPAIQASRPRLSETLKEGGRSATAGGARLRLRRGLVVGEIALALPLLVAAALSVLTVHRFLNGPQGFNPEGLLTMRLLLPEARYPDGPARTRFAGETVDRLRALPGVVSAAAVNVMPASDNNSGRSVEVDGIPNPDPANPPSVDYRTATPTLFETLQIPIRSGRGFTDADREDTEPVAIVTESLARRHWPNSDALGKRIKLGTGPWLTVVGVSGDHIHNWFGRRNYPTIYRPFKQAPASGMALIVRTSRNPSTVAAEARAAVRSVDSSQPVFELQPMRQTLLERTLGLQYVGAIMFAFGGLALLLAVIGVYGVMASMVTQRTHEIGVRMALGATRSDVLRLTVGQAGKLTAVGVGLGVTLSLLLGRFIEAGLLGVASSDARITASLAAILVASALAAGYLPARRAASIDPTVALRGE